MKTPKSALPIGRQPKPRLVIPRFSEIKRTYKDGRPRAPVDINLDTQRIHQRRQKIEEKLLCDTGEIDTAEFLERLHEFYDDEEMRRRGKRGKLLNGTVVMLCQNELGRIVMATRRKLQTVSSPHSLASLAVPELTTISSVVGTWGGSTLHF